MNKISAGLIAALAVMALQAATIEQVIVRQQWPWSTDVKIEYRITGVTTPVDVKVVEAYDGTTALDVARINAAAIGDTSMASWRPGRG